MNHWLLCKLGIQEPNFLQHISGSCSTPAPGDQLQKCVPSLLMLYFTLRISRMFFFTSLWYWGRVSLPPSLTKQLTKPHSSTILPLLQLFVSAEEDTKPTSHVLPCKNELWNVVTRLELFSVYLVPKPWTGGLNFMGCAETSSCFQCWGQNWKQQPEFLWWNKVINNFWVLTFNNSWVHITS